MSTTYWSAAVLAALLGIGSAPRSHAKPPDLPVDQRHACPEGLDTGEALALTPEEMSRLMTEVAPRQAEAQHLFDVAERCRRQGDRAKARTCYEEVHLMCPTSALGRRAIDCLRDLEQGGTTPIDTTEEQDAPPARPTSAEPPLNEAPVGKPMTGNRHYRDMMERSEPLGLVERVY